MPLSRQVDRAFHALMEAFTPHDLGRMTDSYRRILQDFETDIHMEMARNHRLGAAYGVGSTEGWHYCPASLPTVLNVPMRAPYASPFIEPSSLTVVPVNVRVRRQSNRVLVTTREGEVKEAILRQVGSNTGNLQWQFTNKEFANIDAVIAWKEMPEPARPQRSWVTLGRTSGEWSPDQERYIAADYAGTEMRFLGGSRRGSRPFFSGRLSAYVQDFNAVFENACNEVAISPKQRV